MTEAAQILESKSRKISLSSQPTWKNKKSQRDTWEGTKSEDEIHLQLSEHILIRIFIPEHGTGGNIHMPFRAYIKKKCIKMTLPFKSL